MSCYHKQGEIIVRELKRIHRAHIAQGPANLWLSERHGSGIGRSQRKTSKSRWKMNRSHNSLWYLRSKIQLQSLNSPVVDQQKEQSAGKNNSTQNKEKQVSLGWRRELGFMKWLATLFHPLDTHASQTCSLTCRTKWPVWMWRRRKPWMGSETQRSLGNRLVCRQSSRGCMIHSTGCRKL